MRVLPECLWFIKRQDAQERVSVTQLVNDAKGG